MNLINRFRQTYREEKAKLKGEAVSQARRFKPLAEIDKDLNPEKRSPDAKSIAPAPTRIAIRDKRGRIMVYYTDGSLRHHKAEAQ